MVSNTMEDIEINVDDSVDLIVSFDDEMMCSVFTFRVWHNDYNDTQYYFEAIIMKIRLKARVRNQ